MATLVEAKPILAVTNDLITDIGPTQQDIKLAERALNTPVEKLLSMSLDDDSRASLNQLLQYPPLSLNEQFRYGYALLSFRQSHTPNLAVKASQAREMLTLSTQRLVATIARQYTGRGLPFMDLFQEGNAGIQMAIDRYDPTWEYPFPAHSVMWIRKAIRGALIFQSGVIRIPRRVYSFRPRVLEHLEKLSTEIRTQLKAGELDPADARSLLSLPNLCEAIASSLTAEKETSFREDKRDAITSGFVRNVLLAPFEPGSLDQPTNSSEEEGDFSLVTDAPDEGTFIQPTDMDTLTDVEEAIDALPFSARNKYIIRKRSGLIDGQEHTQDELADELGVNRSRIGQIESAAFNKLRKSLADYNNHLVEEENTSS